MSGSVPNEVLLIDAAEVSRMLAISTRTIWRLLSAGRFPKPIRIGRSVRWKRDTLVDWIAEGCPEVK